MNNRSKLVLSPDRKTAIFGERYAKKGEDSVESVMHRVAMAVATSYESNHGGKLEDTADIVDEWVGYMSRFEFVPGGRILSNAGVDKNLLNCFVVPVDDSIGGIFDSLKRSMMIQGVGGGVGFNFGGIRPKGYPTSGLGVASGPCSFIDVFDKASDTISSTSDRKAANMGILPVWHPDIREFIRSKVGNDGNTGRWIKFNISVAVNNKFINAVKSGSGFDLMWDGKVVDTIDAAGLWKEMVDSQWLCGDPGLWNYDTANEMNNTGYFQELIGTNPCGEISLPAWGSCCLGSINLSKFVVDGSVDIPALERVAGSAVKFLDSVITENEYLFDEMEAEAKLSRRIGLGVMGVAHALMKMGIRYGSEEARLVVGSMMTTIRDAAYETSTMLATCMGSFTGYDEKKYTSKKSGYTKSLPNGVMDKIKARGIRNSTLLTVAPTGTTSVVAGSSSGIEPVYSLKFVQKRFKDGSWHSENVMDPIYEEWLNKNPEGAAVPDYFVTSKNIHPDDHLKMQLAVQAVVDNSISKTINMPSHATRQEVSKVLLDAMTGGAKGCTIYRDGSLSHQPLSDTPSTRNKGVKIRRGLTYEISTPQGKAYVTINDFEQGGGPMQVFIRADKPGSDSYAYCNAMGRLISIGLQDGTDPKRIANTLMGINSSGVTWEFMPDSQDKPVTITSVPDAVAKLMLSYCGEPVVIMDNASSKAVMCSNCGAPMEMIEGCLTCRSCGNALCQ